MSTVSQDSAGPVSAVRAARSGNAQISEKSSSSHNGRAGHPRRRNAVCTTWATALDTRRSAAVARSFGATPADRRRAVSRTTAFLRWPGIRQARHGTRQSRMAGRKEAADLVAAPSCCWDASTVAASQPSRPHRAPALRSRDLSIEGPHDPDTTRRRTQTSCTIRRRRCPPGWHAAPNRMTVCGPRAPSAQPQPLVIGRVNGYRRSPSPSDRIKPETRVIRCSPLEWKAVMIAVYHLAMRARCRRWAAGFRGADEHSVALAPASAHRRCQRPQSRLLRASSDQVSPGSHACR